eukprot:UN21264
MRKNGKNKKGDFYQKKGKSTKKKKVSKTTTRALEEKLKQYIENEEKASRLGRVGKRRSARLNPKVKPDINDR